jgi:EAL domain-containing protein (putative c-di-GMP-specific phosphodiesterase class I)
MPLTDLVRNLNARSRPPHGVLHSPHPLVAAEGRVFVHYADLRLESRFLPYVEAVSGRILGHAAVLRTVGLASGRELDPAAVFALPADADELVCLDRLVRTLHALNYLTHPKPGNPLLKVHPKHVASIPADHGLAFEEILRPCGLVPAQITLEIEAGGADDASHLKRAVANYKSRGYGVALCRFGNGSIDFGLLRELQPDMVKLDAALLASGRPLHRLIGGLHNLGILAMADGLEIPSPSRGGPEADIDLIQIREPVRRLLHALPHGLDAHAASAKRQFFPACKPSIHAGLQGSTGPGS